MNIDYKNIYFIGIGGIGMSAIARFFNQNDCFVAGYDSTETPLTKQLIEENIFVHYNDNKELIPDKILRNKKETLIVYTPAIPTTHTELKFLTEQNFTILKRAEVLGLLSSNNKTLAIAGTHGKTTITAIVSHIFKENNQLNAAFVGGIVKNYNSNLILGENDKKNWIIIEADEFDRSFLNFYPNLSLISSIDADHLDVYGTKNNLIISFEKFAKQTSEFLLTNEIVDIKISNKLKSYKYGIKTDNDFYSTNEKITGNKQVFDIVYPNGICKNISIKLPGKVNIENSIAAFSMAYLAGINAENIKKSLESFIGIERRFDLIIENSKNVYINDYAHHPTEINRLNEAVRQFYPNRKITAIFQPHLFSRTRDFVNNFAKSLEKFDEVILLDIYPARETPISGVSSKIILEKINNSNKEICKLNNAIKVLKNRDLDIILTIGAGDINLLVEEIKNILL